MFGPSKDREDARWPICRRLAAVPAIMVLGLPLTLATSTGSALAQPTPASWTAYVAEAGPTSTSVIPLNVSTNAPGSPISVGSNPSAVAITPDAKTAYVANRDSNNVTPIDVATSTAGTPIAVGSAPVAIAVTPDGKTVYVVNQGSNNVTPIDVATNAPGAPIPVGSSPEGIAISPNGQRAYVTNEGPSSSSVTPIVTATNTAQPPIALDPSSAPTAIAITPDDKTAYVVETAVNEVVPIDVGTKMLGTRIPTGNFPLGIAITPDGKTAYVANFIAPGGSTPPTVTVIDIATNSVRATISVGTADNSPQAIAVTPDDKTAYVVASANPGEPNVFPIDVATDTVGSGITVGTSPVAIAITPDQAPLAHVSVTPAPVGQPTSFDASASTVPFGTITSYFWQFGDCVWLCTATTTTPTTTHTYGALGTYTAKVTETDSAGTSRTQVFTGQTMSRNGGPSAVASEGFSVGGQPLPTIQPGSASVAEGGAGTTTPLQVPVSLSAASSQTVTAHWATLFVPGAPCCEADPSTDYVPASGTVTFAPGQTTASVTIQVIGGNVVQPNEYIVVSFTNPTNANIGGFWGLGFGGILSNG
jgi:YVTN family beta-propeller protein